MSVTNINPEKEPIPRSWVPRVIIGGKEPPSEYECWLERLPVGTVFLTHYTTVCWGDLYELIWKGDKFYLLHHIYGDGTVKDCYVIPSLFCNIHIDYEILHQEEENNDRNQSQSRTMDGDASVSGVVEGSEETEQIHLPRPDQD